MLVVSVLLHSAITGKTTEIARSVIHNVGGSGKLGDYETFSCRGRDAETLQKSMVSVLRNEATPVHKGRVEKHRRLEEHVWNLVAKSLTAMGYK
jgi:hypothetical protein